ncbi:MAG TPA: serine hydrolase domain-containing protein [Bryobacteraceae bacterium]|nr:serine hydrolase domain-containing protein [Bryobacteraceae bacterium]
MRFLVVAAAVAGIHAQTVPQFSDPQRLQKLTETFPEIDRTLERWHTERGAPGLVYGIVIDGKLAHVRAFGQSNLEAKTPVTPRTVFRIASMTKSFTALAVLKLRDEGKLSLEDPISRFIPQFSRMPLATRDAAPIRVRHLLTHGAGFPEDNPWGDQQLGISEETLDAWLNAGVPFSNPTELQFEYSNYGFALLGRIISVASGTPYAEYLDREILKPLGMTASALEPAKVPAALRAIGYRRKPDRKYEEEKPLPHGAFGAMGGLLTSAEDLARYVAFHLAAWPPRDEAETGPVRRSSVREMQEMGRSSGLTVRSATGTAPLSVVSGAYGYGLGVSRDCRFRHIVGHGGGLPGFGSFMLWLPEHGVGLFAMSNLTYAGPAGALHQALDAMKRTGALQSRELPPSPVLTMTRDTIYKSFWQTWDEAAVGKAAANNLLLDEPAEQRKAGLAKLRARGGKCTGTSEVAAENLLRGTFRIDCENGPVHVTFTLAPTQPPTIQHLAFSEQPRSNGDNVCRP